MDCRLILLFFTIFVLNIQNAYSQTQQQYLFSIECPRQFGCVCQNFTLRCFQVDLKQIPRIQANTITLDLRGNKITNIPTRHFLSSPTIKYLHLSINSLTKLEENAFLGLRNLIDLYLYSNFIDTIHPKAFNDLQKIRNIYLHNNKLKTLEAGTFVGLQVLEKINLFNNEIVRLKDGLFDRNAYIKDLRLGNNKLQCDCDLLWLKQLFDTYKHSYRYSTNKIIAICTTPNNFINRDLISLNEADFGCSKPMLVSKSENIELNTNSIPNMIKLECKFQGNPMPKVSWMKDNIELNPDEKYEFTHDNILVIQNANENDAGYYECTAKSRLGEAQDVIKVNFLKQETTTAEPDSEDYYDFSEDSEPNQQDTKFTMMPSDQNATERSNVVLNCRTVYPFRVHWLKNGERINRDSHFYINSYGDLVISNVQPEDEGFYTCAISDGTIERYAQAELTVNVPPSILKFSDDTEMVEGGSIEFYCMVIGKPDPQITWKLNGQILNREELKATHEFLQDGQQLRIHNLRRNVNDGVYTCIAQNHVGKGSASLHLQILEPIAPYFTRVEQNITIYENHAVTLSCFASGEPKPQVFWYKDGQRIGTDTRVFFDSYGYLSISEVKAFDTGEYLCKATNTAGSVLHSFYLSVKDLHDEIISNDVINDVINRAKGDVNKQIGEAVKYLNDKRRKPKTASDLLALLRFPKNRTINIAIGEEVYERALELIFKYASNVTYESVNDEFKLEEILTHRQLQTIADLSGCSRHKRRVNCTQRCLTYRTSDGTCNNLDHPHRGSANTPLKRLLPAEYENGFSTPRGWTRQMLHNGYKLPSARAVSSRIISTKKITNDGTFTHMLMQWGQFFDHDLDHTAMAASLNRFSNGLACRDSCTNDQPCFPIELPQNDSFSREFPDKCIEFIRSSAVCGSGETSYMSNKIIQREQINQLTSYIDASNVYGSNDQDAFDLRERVTANGQLKVHVTAGHENGLLPFNLDTPMDCQRDNTTQVGCFLAGDYRANEQLALLAMHNVWVRQHNRLAARLRQLNPHWNHEQVYQEARKIVGAQMQHITYKQWLPYIFGDKGMKALGDYRGYDSTVDPSISNEFATAAFRFGHGLIQPFSFRLNESLQPIPEGHLLLRDSFFAPQRFFYEGGPDPLIRGLFAMPAKLKMPREIMNDELTEKLFHITRTISQDLAALNIQRARDHGLSGYAAYRKYCNMSEVKTFDDLKEEISSKEVRDILRELYGDVRNIDLWPGGILEDVMPGSKLGPLFMCIIGEQMKALRDGDRFWYENPGQFSAAQLAEIKKTNLAKIICETSDGIRRIQRDVFKMPKSPRNPMVSCSQIEDVSLEPWRNCCKNNAMGMCGETSLFLTSTEYGDRTKRDTSEN